MQTVPPKADPPKRKRRWFQFSLRSLLIVVTLLALPCAWLGKKIERKRSERNAVAAIVKLGGKVFYDYERGRVSPAGPDCLRKLFGEDFFNDVEDVDLSQTSVADDGLENLRTLTQLKVLRLAGTNVTDAGLTNLKTLRELEALTLSGTAVSDAGLKNLRSLTQLNFLDLRGTNITEAGEKELEELVPHIMYLNEDYHHLEVQVRPRERFGNAEADPVGLNSLAPAARGGGRTRE